MAPPLFEANLCIKIDFRQRYGSEEAVWFTVNMIELWAIACVSRGKFMSQFWRINESNDNNGLGRCDPDERVDVWKGQRLERTVLYHDELLK